MLLMNGSGSKSRNLMSVFDIIIIRLNKHIVLSTKNFLTLKTDVAAACRGSSNFARPNPAPSQNRIRCSREWNAMLKNR